MMNQSCVVVCAGNQARLFTLEPVEFPELESGPNLVLQKQFSGEDGSRIWSDIDTGRNRAPSGASHGYDDHRAKHVDEFERRFAQDVATETRRLVSRKKIDRVVLVANDHTLNALRNAFQAQFRNGTQVFEVSKDLGRLKPQEIQERLARERVLPARNGPQGGPP